MTDKAEWREELEKFCEVYPIGGRTAAEIYELKRYVRTVLASLDRACKLLREEIDEGEQNRQALETIRQALR